MKRFAILLLPVIAWSQSVEGPAIGFLWNEPNATLVQIRGIPGSATRGRAGDPPAQLKFGVGSQTGFAAGIGRDGRVHVLGAAGWKTIDAAPEGAQKLWLSDSGSAAFVLYPDGVGRTITGLPDTPTVSRAYSGAPAADDFTLSSDGSVMLAAAPDEGTVWVMNEAGHQWTLSLEAPVRTIAFLGDRDAVAASGDGVWVIRDVAGNAARERIWSAPVLAAAPVRSQASHGRAAPSRVLMLSEDGLTLTVIDPETGQAEQFPAPVRASGFVRMTRDGVFRLHSGSEPLWMVDLTGAQARSFFVPAAEE